MSWLARIHKLNRSLEEVASGKVFDAEIYELHHTDLRSVTKANGWHFDWQKELNTVGRKVYKIVIENDVVIQGVVSMEDRKTYFFLPLIESAPHNFGRHKQYKGVARSLTAFACKRSFEFGYEGEVTFYPKTSLIEHYKTELGAVQLTERAMIIPTENARKLVSLYFQ